jgi:hypothetical protein
VFATEPVTAVTLRDLPRWARVAFAVRSGRRVQPLLRQLWHNPQPALLQAFDRALALAEQSAAQGCATEGLDEEVQTAQTYAPAMAGIATMCSPGSPPARVPASDIVQYAVAATAVAAGQAAQAAARGDDDAAAAAAAAAYDWAVHAALSMHVFGLDRVLQADLRALQQATEAGQLSDGTPVGPGFFALERELSAFRRELPRLLAQAEGQFALVHEDKVEGVWSTYEDALQAGYERHQLKPFLVKQVRSGADLG